MTGQGGNIIAFPTHRVIRLRIGDVKAFSRANRAAAIRALYEVDRSAASSISRQMRESLRPRTSTTTLAADPAFRRAHAIRFKALRASAEGRKSLAQARLCP